MPEYIEWKKSVKLRDGNMCKRCGNQRSVEVHHKTSLSELLRQNQVHTLEDAKHCPSLWMVSNGECVCRKCHGKVDPYRAGYLDNTYKPTR